MAPDLSVIEAQRCVAQTRIDGGRSAPERNRLGQFATPGALADEIARFVAGHMETRSGSIRFADPAIGSGSFFSAALRVFGAGRIERAVGIEIDPAFCDTARTLFGDLGLEVVEGDFTKVVEHDLCGLGPDVILANPPYVRHHHLLRDDKRRLGSLAERLTGIKVNGLAGLYVYFLMLATAWMDDDGLAAWLIPSEFMDVNYGAAVKELLTEHVTLVRIHRFDPAQAQFDDAIVSSAVVVFRKRRPDPKHKAEITLGGTLAEPALKEMVSLERLRSTRKWTALPVRVGNDRRISQEDHGPTVDDLFRIRRGMATGCNKFFILSRDRAGELELPERFLRPILPSPRHLKETVIETDEQGWPRLDQSLCIIDCDLDEYTVETQHPGLWAYLRTAEALGIRGGYLIGSRTPWYRQEQRQPAPFVCTYMGRGANGTSPFRFIWNKSQAICTNLYLMLYPRGPLANMLAAHPGRAEQVHAFLADISAHELRGQGRVYGGGLNKIEPRELGRVSMAALAGRWPELAHGPAAAQTPGLFDMQRG